MSLRWKIAALVLACLLPVAAGHYRPQLDAANDTKGQCVAARGNLEEPAKEQRQAKAAQ